MDVAGELSLLGDGEVCARLGYDETDVMFLSRECVPPLGGWRLNVASRGLITIDVTDAGIRCGP